MSAFSTCRSRRARRDARALVLACTVLVASRAAALDPERALPQYLRHQWTSESGFPGGPVSAIGQTTDGYLWIGAEKGLFRFDGLTFRRVDPGSAPDAGPAVLGVTGAADGSLWVRLKGVALVRYHAGVFEDLLAEAGRPASVVSAMERGRNGDMLIATLARGALAYRGGRFAPVAGAAALPSSSFIVAIAEATTGEIWLGTRDAGLFRISGGTVTRYTTGLPDLKINCLLAGPDGEVWLGTDRGVARWDGTAITQAGVPAALRRTPALGMIRDREANLWIAAGARGLYRVAPGGAVQSSAEAGWALGHVAATFEDRDGNLWIGTDRGLERWRDPAFTTWPAPQGTPRDASGPVYPADDGRVWYGPSSGGLFWLRDGRVHQVTEAGLSGDVVYSIHGGGREVWVGRQRGGITVLRGDGDAVRAERFTERQGLAQDSVFAIHRARDGAVWAGTLSGGASVLRQGRFTTYDTRNGLPSNTVASILEAKDGTMWFGTPNGLTAFSGSNWRTYTTRDGLPSNDVNTVFEDRAGVVWAGTAKGLAVVEAAGIRTVGAAASELRESMLGLADDRRGSLWIATADGIVRAGRDALLGGRLEANDLRRYGAADGLLGVDATRRHRVVAPDAKDRIWFALTSGLAMADPGRADQRALPAVTFVEQLAADGTPIAVGGPIRIPASGRRIAVTYAGLSLSVPERVRFRYRLDGFDADWSDPVAERQAVYTNLAPGHYRFRVRASNSDGLWNGPEATLPFEVTPTIWQTTGFRLFAVALAALTGWGVYRLRVRQVARRLNARFEERLAERTRIAQELHDTLLQGFVSASMQLHVAVERLPEDSPARSALGRVHDLMRRVIDEGRHAVRGLRSASTDPHDLEQAFSGVQQEVGIAGPAYHVIVEGRPRPLTPIVRDEVYRIGREGLVNAFRHAGAAHIEIELEFGARELCVLVRDDGRGMDPRVVQDGADGHWGLTGMRERARRIGGTLKIRSREAAGTEVELRVPAHLAFERHAAPDPTENEP